jgi:hypothetical protein
MFRPSDPERRQSEKESAAYTEFKRAHPVEAQEQIESDRSLAADHVLDAEVREELSHVTPDGAPPDSKSRHDSSALFYGLAAVVALGVIGAMIYSLVMGLRWWWRVRPKRVGPVA